MLSLYEALVRHMPLHRKTTLMVIKASVSVIGFCLIAFPQVQGK
jgi:hypothetical protein